MYDCEFYTFLVILVRFYYLLKFIRIF